jgi:3-oxoacyl-[acyl-carrier protein] reductase
MLLKNKTAVITGCNKGIGKEILKIFSENGAKVFACVRVIDEKFKAEITNLKTKNNSEIIPISFDLLNEDQIKEAAKKILTLSPTIDILVNNAGAVETALFQMTSSKKLKEIFEVNFFSQITLTQFILKSMIKNKSGSIINISSISGLDANVGRSAYSASKSALITQSKALSKEVGEHNVRVNSVAPGLVNTDMLNKNTSSEIIEKMIQNTSLRRIANPIDIANVVLFLSSDLSKYITGQVIRVDGGI